MHDNFQLIVISANSLTGKYFHWPILCQCNNYYKLPIAMINIIINIIAIEGQCASYRKLFIISQLTQNCSFYDCNIFSKTWFTYFSCIARVNNMCVWTLTEKTKQQTHRHLHNFIWYSKHLFLTFCTQFSSGHF